MGANQPRIGLLGAGFISDYHAAGLLAAGAAITAICGRDEANAMAKAARYGIPHVTTDPFALIEHPNVDAVVIATPDDTHESFSLAALSLGKPVLVQKPMARTVAGGDLMIAAARASGALLCVSFMHRYFEEIDAARALVTGGRLGRLLTIRQRNATPGADWATWQYRHEQAAGGVVMQLGIHGIDLLRSLFGEIVAVQATTALVQRERRLPDGTIVVPDHEDTAFATYRFASGLLATHEMSLTEVAGTDRFRLEIYGADGTAWLRTERGRLAIFTSGDWEWSVPALADEPFGVRQHRHFLAMVRGDVPPDGSDVDGLAGLRVAMTVYRSAASGCWEEVDHP